MQNAQYTTAHHAANRSEKYPVEMTAACSPGLIKFAATTSQPSAPDPASTTACEPASSAPHTVRRRRSTRPKTAAKSASTWLIWTTRTRPSPSSLSISARSCIPQGGRAQPPLGRPPQSVPAPSAAGAAAAAKPSTYSTTAQTMRTASRPAVLGAVSTSRCRPYAARPAPALPKRCPSRACRNALKRDDLKQHALLCVSATRAPESSGLWWPSCVVCGDASTSLL